MTPVETLLTRFLLPFTFYPYQDDVINDLAPRPKAGHYLEVGTGKTATSTGCGLYKMTMGQIDHSIVCIPPILFLTWKRWLESITDTKTGQKLRVLLYRGSPAKRKQMNLRGYDFIIMTYQIFKKDYERIEATFDHARTYLICDEATAIKNIGSDNYKFVRNLSMDGHLALLTGTPLNKLEDAYAYIKLLSPDTYRNYNQFANLHIESEDFFGNPKAYCNVDMLRENMTINSRRLLQEDVLKQMPEVTYTPIHYELADAHMKLYKQLAEEQMLEFDDGSKLDATQTTALWHALQQVVMNYGYFSDDESNVAAGIELLDEVMEEIGDRKLIVFSNYRMTSALLTEYGREKYGAVAVYGDITGKQKDKNVDRFVTDPTCRMMVIQVQAGGFGLDGLQHVCSDMLFLEAPLLPIQFIQAVGRLKRNGQKRSVHVRIGVAQGTIQVHLHNLLLNNDETVNRVVRNVGDLRDLLYGNKE